MRGLAVAAVLAFHAEFGWAEGGYLGVSTFFTLSGFLITGLLLGEHATTGRIDLRHFWARRFRRLLPAMLVALVGVAAYARWLAPTDQLVAIREDGLATLGYVANWRFVVSGQSYADLFAEPSPLLHAWSLAIEEQFYLLYPLLAFGVLVLARRDRRAFTVVLAGLLVASVVASNLFAGDQTRAYYGTDARAAELLVGALLAVWVGRVGNLDTRRRRGLVLLGPVALGVLAVCWVTVEQSSGWLYRGGFAAYAVVSAAVVAASVAPGPVRRALSVRGLRGLGLVSYGVYLYHWPIYLWLSPHRTGLSTWPLLAVRLLVTLGAAVLSYHLIEQPIRRGRLPGIRALVAAPVGAVVVVVMLLVGTVVPSGASRLAADRSAERLVGAAPLAPPRALATAREPLRVLMVGDSVGFDAEPGIVAALEATGAATVVAENRLGFGLTNDSLDWRARWAALVQKERPGLVVMLLGGWDESFIEARGRSAYTDVAVEAAELLTADGARLLILGYPITLSRLTEDVNPRASVRALAAVPGRMPGRVAFQSLDPALTPSGVFVERLPGPSGTLERVRKVDGTHFCPSGAARIGRLVLDAVGPVWSLPEPPPSWRSGRWAEAPRYDDPPGACPP